LSSKSVFTQTSYLAPVVLPWLLFALRFFSRISLSLFSISFCSKLATNWRVRTKIYLSKPFWTVVFQVWQAFSSCVFLLFPSSSEAEVLSDLVLLFLLSSARTYLLLTDELNHFYVFITFGSSNAVGSLRSYWSVHDFVLFLGTLETCVGK
jgi:hypothetical protein